MKRKSIRRKVQNLVLLISVVALDVTSAVGIFSMITIQRESEGALVSQMEQNLTNITSGRAEMANAVLSDYADDVENSASYISRLYKNPTDYFPRSVLPSMKENGGVLAMQRALRDEAVQITDVMSELELLGNTEAMWNAIILSKKRIITTIYLGTESGFLLSYDTNSDLTPESGKELYYDYTKSGWYTLAKEKKSVCFTDVYHDTYGRGMMITCAAPFYDADGNFAGVTAMDILIEDLYRAVVDIHLGEDSYAFIMNDSWEILTPPGKSAEVHGDFDAVSAFKVFAQEAGTLLTNSRIYYAHAPIKFTGWKLFVRIPERVILLPVASVNRRIIFTILSFVGLFGLTIALAVVAARTFSAKLTEPIISLERDVNTISGGNLDYRAEIRSNDEIGDLAKSFNDMAASLKDYVKNLAAVTAEKERIGAELDIASQIQLNMLPRNFPESKEFEIFASMTPAKEVGGDFYDFFFIDEDHLGLVMADVSGKGVPAALFMAIAKALIRTRSMLGGTPSEILADVNSQLCEGNDADLFVTVWLGILELSTGKVTASNAGHEYPAIYRKDEGYSLFKTKQSPAVATMDGLRFKTSEFELKAGDNLYLYTDGVAEATNIHEELYGTDRMIEALNSTIGMSAKEILSVMKKSVDDFTGEAPQFDDITMISLRYFGK